MLCLPCARPTSYLPYLPAYLSLPLQAYTLGGSVTSGAGASEPSQGYPHRFFEFITHNFPHK